MRIMDYEQALVLFDLSKLKTKGLVDLTVDANGNIAITRDGDLQMGEARVNALFRLLERWRISQFTVNALYATWRSTRDELKTIQCQHKNSSLVADPRRFHSEAESISELEENAGILAGAIFVVLNNLLQRFKQDLELSQGPTAASTPTPPPFEAVITAAAANFRHYDEWAGSSVVNSQQQKSVSTLCHFLGMQSKGTSGRPAIRSNVCGLVLEKLSDDAVETLYRKLFDCAKAAARYEAL